MIYSTMKTLLRACTAVSAVVVLSGCYRVTMPGVSFTPDTGWIREEPTSDHRMIQYRLRGKGEQAGDARLVVYHFGEQGPGSEEAHVTRWAAQFRQPDGRPSLDVVRREDIEVDGVKVHTIELEGTYVAAVRPGSRCADMRGARASDSGRPRRLRPMARSHRTFGEGGQSFLAGATLASFSRSGRHDVHQCMSSAERTRVGNGGADQTVEARLTWAPTAADQPMEEELVSES